MVSGTKPFDDSNLPSLRLAILTACLGWFCSRALQPILLPYGGANTSAMDERIKYAPVDPTNDSLQIKHGKLQKIFERMEEGKRPLLVGPETVVIDNDGVLHVLTEEANLVRMTDFELKEDGGSPMIVTAKTTLVANLGHGRPLGGRYTSENTLYVADAVMGLARISNPGVDKHSKLEIVATEVMHNGKMTRINFADDVAVGPKTGMIYFTDATSTPATRELDFVWDVMYASKVDVIQSSRTGRLLRYDPKTEEVVVLADKIFFANGIAVDKDETFILFAETFALRLIKYHLSGEKKDTMEYIVDGDPATGYYDGVDCAWKGVTSDNDRCYGIHPSTVVPVHKALNKIPSPIDMVVRTLILTLPKWLVPKMQSYAAISVVDAKEGKFIELLQDPTGKDIGFLTGVTVHDNKLYLGSLENDYVGVYDMN